MGLSSSTESSSTESSSTESLSTESASTLTSAFSNPPNQEALFLVQSLRPGDFSQQNIRTAQRIFQYLNCRRHDAPFLHTAVTEHLFSVLVGFDGSEFETGNVNDFLFLVTGSIYFICSRHNESHDLLLIQSNAETLFKLIQADKTCCLRGVSFHAIVAVFFALKHRPNDAALHRLYLADPRFTNCIVDYFEHCQVSDDIQILCKEVFDSLNPSITARANFISSLKNHPQIVPALQSAAVVRTWNDSACEVMKLARLILGKTASHSVKSLSQLQQEAVTLVESLKVGDFTQNAVEIAKQIWSSVSTDQRYEIFSQTTVTQHLFRVLAGYGGREFREGPVQDVLFNVTCSIFYLCARHDGSRDLLPTQANSEILFKFIKADKTRCRAVAATCIRIILHAIELRPDHRVLQQLYLAVPRVTNLIVDFLENCGAIQHLRVTCEEFLDSLKPSMSAHNNLIRSLKNHPRIVPALQHANESKDYSRVAECRCCRGIE